MKIEPHTITIRQLVDGYRNDDEEGVVAFGGKLDIRPKYQREFIYSDEEQKEFWRGITSNMMTPEEIEAIHKAEVESDDVESGGAQESALSIRKFTDSQKRAAYERQGGKCTDCGKRFEFEEMHGDHRMPWSRGGHTVPDNLQMLCRLCNLKKSNL